MMKNFTRTIIAVLGVIALLSCEHQEDVVVPQKENYYDLYLKAMSTTFNKTYENITINTSFGEMADQFEKNSKDFFLKKGIVVTSADIARTRGSHATPLSYDNNLTKSEKAIIDEVLEIMQSPDYNYVRLSISQLHSRVSSTAASDERMELQQYVEFIEKMLDFLENEKGKFDVLNVLAKYNEFHEFEFSEIEASGIPFTRQGLADGIYPHPQDENKFIIVVGNTYYVSSCSAGNVFRDNCNCCTWADGGSNKEGGWWDAWGKCAASILGSAGGGVLAGGSAGSAWPGLGTLAGAIAGALSGAFMGAAAGC